MDASRTPRFAGPPTFALLPRRDEVSRCDVAVVGVPFDSGTSYRPGARFGPAAVRQGSRLLRPWNPGLEVAPFGAQQVADAGDIACNPFDIKEAVDQIETAAASLQVVEKDSYVTLRLALGDRALETADAREVLVDGFIGLWRSPRESR